MPDYYPEMPTGDDSAPPQPDQPAPNESKDDMDADTALLPKSIFAGKDYKVGDEIKLKIVHDYDDEVEVQCMHDKKDNNSNDQSSSYMDDALGKMGQQPDEEMA